MEMHHRTIRLAVRSVWRPSFLSIVMAATAATMLAAAPAQSEDDIPGLIQSAREHFTPIGPQQLAGIKGDLKQRMNELEQFVHPSSTNGQKWLRYLQWEDLKKELAGEGAPSMKPLMTTYQRLNKDENGLELPAFRRVSDALRKYADAFSISQWENPADLYGKQLDGLTAALDAYRTQRSSATEAKLADQLGRISAVGQAPELVAAVRREFAQPNAYIDISSGLLAAAAEPINRVEPLRDVILGTQIRGDSHTTGHVTVAPIPSYNNALLELTSIGRIVSDNVGTNGPAVIRSTAFTNFAATKRVELSDAAFITHGAQVDATTRSDIHSVGKKGGGIGSRLVSSMAWKQVREKHGRADQISSDHAEDRILRKFNDEVGRKISDARKQYEDNFRRPLMRRGELPPDIHFSSSREGVAIQATQASQSQLGAAGPPPVPAAAMDMSMRLHETAINNYLGALLGGATASESQPGQKTQFDVKLPDWLKKAWDQRKATPTTDPAAKDEPFEAFALKFRHGRPITVNFADGKVKFTAHISQLKTTSRNFENWDVTGTFTPILADGGIILKRDGDLEVLPTGFDRVGGKLSTDQIAERSNLTKELNKRSAQGRGFPAQIEFAALEPTGILKSAGQLATTECYPNDGWLTMTWNRM